MFKKKKKPNLFLGHFPQSATDKISLQNTIIKDIGLKHYHTLDFRFQGELSALIDLRSEETFLPQIIFLYNFFDRIGHTDESIRTLSESTDSVLIVLEKEKLQKRLLFSASNAFFPYKLSS